MTINELILELQKYPEDADLKDINIETVVLQHRPSEAIKAVYIADYRIVGGKPLGNEISHSYKCKLDDVANALLLGLKFREL